MLRSSIQGQNGNCTKQDETDILEVIGDSYKAKNTESNVTINKAAIIRKYDLQGTNQSQDDDSDYSDAPSFSNVSEFKKHCNILHCWLCGPDGAEENHLLCLS